MVQIILFVKLTKSVPNIDQKDYTELLSQRNINIIEEEQLEIVLLQANYGFFQVFLHLISSHTIHVSALIQIVKIFSLYYEISAVVQLILYTVQ